MRRVAKGLSVLIGLSKFPKGFGDLLEIISTDLPRSSIKFFARHFRRVITLTISLVIRFKKILKRKLRWKAIKIIKENESSLA